MENKLIVFTIFTIVVLVGIILFTESLHSATLCITILMACTTLTIHQFKLYKIIKGDEEDAAPKPKPDIFEPQKSSFKEGPIQIQSKAENESKASGKDDGYIASNDPIADALKGLDELHSLPMYSQTQSIMNNIDWKRKQEARNQGYLDLKKIEDHKLRFRMNKSRDGFKRAMNPEHAAKFFNEELDQRERAQWWGM